MAIGDALSKSTTYKQVEDIVRLRTSTVSDTTLTSSLIFKLISVAIQKWAKVLNGATAPFYTTTASNKAITGSANPFSVDLSSLSPFIDSIKKVVLKPTSGSNTRTFVKKLAFEDAENIQDVSSFYASSVFYAWEGDALRLFKGDSFTLLTPTTEVVGAYVVDVTYYRLPIVTSITDGTFLDIPDSYTSTIITEVTNQILSFKNNGVTVASLDQELVNEREAIKNAFGLSKQLEQTEKI